MGQKGEVIAVRLCSTRHHPYFARTISLASHIITVDPNAGAGLIQLHKGGGTNSIQSPSVTSSSIHVLHISPDGSSSCFKTHPHHKIWVGRYRSSTEAAVLGQIRRGKVDQILPADWEGTKQIIVTQ